LRSGFKIAHGGLSKILRAQVRFIDIREAKPRPALRYFSIKPSPLHEELQEGFGAMQSIFMDYWGEFRDYREELRGFARRMDENFKAIWRSTERSQRS
jgi:hypothetical protein